MIDAHLLGNRLRSGEGCVLFFPGLDVPLTLGSWPLGDLCVSYSGNTCSNLLAGFNLVGWSAVSLLCGNIVKIGVDMGY